MSRSRALNTAILLWKRGTPLPADLYARLADEGLEVAALENKYAI